jgi:hypothetical protein
VFVELIDRLRCPDDHPDTWLVAAATRTARRHLLDATLGCPACGAEFELREGELWFGDRVECAVMPASEEETLRLAALLQLEERGLYLLDGGWGSLAFALHGVVDVDLLLADPPPAAAHETMTAGQGTLRGVGDRWPLASSSLHGIALDRATPARTADAARVLRPGGRLVAPVRAAVPTGVRELARDDRHWVAEKEGDLVSLSRARG